MGAESVLHVLTLAGYGAFGLALMVFVWAMFQKQTSQNKTVGWLEAKYEDWQQPMITAVPALVRSGLSLYLFIIKIVSYAALLSLVLALFFLNTMVEWAYESAGVAAAWPEIADGVARLKRVLQISVLIMVVAVGISIAIAAHYARTDSGRTGDNVSQQLSLILGIGYLLSVLIPSIYGTVFLFNGYFPILDDLSSNGVNFGFLKAQLFILPLHNIALGFTSVIIAVFVAWAVPIIRHIEFTDLFRFFYIRLLLVWFIGVARAFGRNAAERDAWLDSEEASEQQQAIVLTAMAEAQKRHFQSAVTTISSGFISGVALSYLLTAAGVALGRALAPESDVNIFGQLLFWNLVFDGVTVLVTLYALRWALQGGFIKRFPVAAIFDIAVSAILAVCSIYLSMLGTEYELSVGKAISILFMSYDDNGSALGPYFWIMCSTFLPTVFIYTAFLVVGLLAYFLANFLFNPILKRVNRDQVPALGAVASQFVAIGVALIGAGSGRLTELASWAGVA